MAVVTKVEVCAKNKNRVNIFVDNCFLMATYAEVCIKNKIEKGTVADEVCLKKLLLEEEKAKAADLAVKYLSRFYKTKKELETYLAKKQFKSETIAETIKKCEEYGYLNDGKFAQSFCDFKKNSFSGRHIKFALKQKGVANQYIENLQFNDSAAIENLCLKFFAKKEKTKENILKFKNFLARKGFMFDEINSTVSALCGETDENWN